MSDGFLSIDSDATATSGGQSGNSGGHVNVAGFPTPEYPNFGGTRLNADISKNSVYTIGGAVVAVALFWALAKKAKR